MRNHDPYSDSFLVSGFCCRLSILNEIQTSHSLGEWRSGRRRKASIRFASVFISRKLAMDRGSIGLEQRVFSRTTPLLYTAHLAPDTLVAQLFFRAGSFAVQPWRE